MERNSVVPSSSNHDEISRLPVPPVGHGDTQPLMALSDPRGRGNDMRFLDGGSQLVPAKQSRDLALEVEEFDIPWEDLVLKERIGAGNSSLLFFILLFNVVL